MKKQLTEIENFIGMMTFLVILILIKDLKSAFIN